MPRMSVDDLLSMDLLSTRSETAVEVSLQVHNHLGRSDLPGQRMATESQAYRPLAREVVRLRGKSMSSKQVLKGMSSTCLAGAVRVGGGSVSGLVAS